MGDSPCPVFHGCGGRFHMSVSTKGESVRAGLKLVMDAAEDEVVAKNEYGPKSVQFT